MLNCSFVMVYVITRENIKNLIEKAQSGMLNLSVLDLEKPAQRTVYLAKKNSTRGEIDNQTKQYG